MWARSERTRAACELVDCRADTLWLRRPARARIDSKSYDRNCASVTVSGTDSLSDMIGFCLCYREPALKSYPAILYDLAGLLRSLEIS
jgi:hypothetical protein